MDVNISAGNVFEKEGDDFHYKASVVRGHLSRAIHFTHANVMAQTKRRKSKIQKPNNAVMLL